MSTITLLFITHAACGMGILANVDIDGFFDAGMLQAALKANQDQKSRPSEKAAARSKVGKKLQLMEY